MSESSLLDMPLPVNRLTTLSLEITSFCNLRCGHCYAESGPHRSQTGVMSRENWLRILQEAAELGCRDVQFIGGEPTLHPDLPVMLETARRLGYRHVEVFTNATTLTPEMAALFARHQVLVAVSFYTPDAAVHEAITGGRGSFRRTIDGMRTAMAAGLKVRAGIIIMDQNRDQLPATIQFLEEMGVVDHTVDIMRQVGRGAPRGARAVTR